MPDIVWGPDLFGHGLGEKLLSSPKTIWISRGKSQHQGSKQSSIIDQPDYAKINAAK